MYVSGVVSIIHDGVSSELPSRLRYGHFLVVLQPCEATRRSLFPAVAPTYLLSQRCRGALTYKLHKITLWKEC